MIAEALMDIGEICDLGKNRSWVQIFVSSETCILLKMRTRYIIIKLRKVFPLSLSVSL